MRSALFHNVDPDWRELFDLILSSDESDSFSSMLAFLAAEKAAGQIIYPTDNLIFNAFKQCHLKKLKLVILGQDPYHNPGQAMGLSFSVPAGIKVPPSLKNIFKELYSDLGFLAPDHGDLSSWADQGVLLLNAMLTVRHKSPGSHKTIGWQKFTDQVIKSISNHKSGIVFLLWGNFAKGKAQLIDNNKHLVLEAAHPSPLARGAFFGSQNFSKSNNYLKKMGQKPINWKII